MGREVAADDEVIGRPFSDGKHDVLIVGTGGDYPQGKPGFSLM
jgi:hypothetical protein